MTTEPYYSDDLVTLYHGDCLVVTEWLAADVLVTDPPYGVAYQQGGPRRNIEGVRSTTPTARVVSDENTTARDAALALWDGPALVFGSWRAPKPPAVRQRLIWWKRNTNPGLGTGTPWSPSDEEIYVIGSGFTGPRELNVLPTDEARASSGGLAALVGHPTPKPLALMESLITKCPPGTVADPFAGSGSTLVAAKALSRKAIGVEIEERYCEIAAKRLAQDAFDFGASA